MDNEEVETKQDEGTRRRRRGGEKVGGHSVDPHCVSVCMTNDLVEVCHPRRLRRSGSLLTGLLSAAPKLLTGRRWLIISICTKATTDGSQRVHVK